MFPHAKKSFGQNFLVDKTVVEKIIKAADIQKGETVLEIGPGTGVLTQALVDAGAHVIAVELDKEFFPALLEKFGDTIELIHGDILQMDILPLLYKEGVGGWSQSDDANFKLIANIPYNITSPIIERFLSHSPRPSRMVLMVQKEVADRILAKPPDMSLLSVVCQIYADCTKVATVKAGAFRPIPKVDSAVVRFDLKPHGGARGKGQGVREEGGDEREAVIAIAKAGFFSKRKQLHNNLSSSLKIDTITTRKLLIAAHLDPKLRAENLTVQDWVRLHQVLKK